MNATQNTVAGLIGAQHGETAWENTGRRPRALKALRSSAIDALLDETSVHAVEVGGEWHLACSAAELDEMLAVANAAALEAFEAYKARME